MHYLQGQTAKGLSCGQSKSAGARNLWALRAVGFWLGCLILVPSVLGRNPDPKEGMKIFWSKACSRCHSILGEGAKIGPDLTRIPSVEGGLDFAAAMLSHGPQMWERMAKEQVQLPKFEPEEMEDLFAFLTMASSLDEPGDATAGHSVFQSKRCVECHSIRGAGGKVGPDLASVNSNRNPVGWIAAMWNHTPGMFRAMAQKKVAFPTFKGNEMADLQAYIRKMSGSTSEDRPYYLYIRPPGSDNKLELRGNDTSLPYYLYFRPPNPDQGENLFREKQCVQCHSVAGYGGRVGPDLSRAALPTKYGAIALILWNHAPQMQKMMATLSIPMPLFEAQELADLLAYLSTVSMKREGDSAAGAAVFSAKGCSGCHSTTPGPKTIGPNLTGLQGNLTPISIARAMWNHGPAMFNQMKQSAVSWPAFNSKELADTLAFLKGIQTSSAQGLPPEPAGNTP